MAGSAADLLGEGPPEEGEEGLPHVEAEEGSHPETALLGEGPAMGAEVGASPGGEAEVEA